MTEDRLESMARAYVEEGLSYKQIGDRYGITRQRVGQLLSPLNLGHGQRQARSIVREQNLRAAFARLEGGESTLKQEATALGYSSGESLRSAFYEAGLHFLQGTPPPEHGTIARYRSRKHACRCAECRRANCVHQARLKGTEPPNHGTYSGYINYGCRCQACKEAHRASLRARRAAKRGREVAV